MTPSGIEPATFRFLAQLLNHCADEELHGKISELLVGQTNVREARIIQTASELCAVLLGRG